MSLTDPDLALLRAVDAGVSTVAQAMATDTPLVWLKLDEPSGNAADSSGNGRTSTYQATPTRQVAGPTARVTQGVGLNGTTQYVAGPGGYNPFTVAGDMTLMSWALRNSTANGDVIIGGSVGSGGTMLLRLQAGADTLNFYPQASAAASWANCGVGTGSWHHVAVTFDNAGNSATAYIDGVSKGPVAMTDDFAASAQTFMVGAWNQVVTVKDFFDGKLASAAIFASALTARRVAEHHAAGLGGPTITLLALRAGISTQAAGVRLARLAADGYAAPVPRTNPSTWVLKPLGRNAI